MVPPSPRLRDWQTCRSPIHAKKNTKLLLGRIFFLISARADDEGCNDYSVCLSRASGRIFDNRYFMRKVNYWNYFRVSVLLVFLLSWRNEFDLDQRFVQPRNSLQKLIAGRAHQKFGR